MWAICRINILGTEILAIEVGHQKKQPEIVEDPPPEGITGGSTMTQMDRRPSDDPTEAAGGWIGFRQ